MSTRKIFSLFVLYFKYFQSLTMLPVLVFCCIFLSRSPLSCWLSTCFKLLVPRWSKCGRYLFFFHFRMVIVERYGILPRNMLGLLGSSKWRSYTFGGYLKCSFFLWGDFVEFPQLNAGVSNVFPLMWVNASLLAEDLLLVFRL